MATITSLVKQGALTADIETQINDNFTNINTALTSGTGLLLTGATGLPGSTGLVAASVGSAQLDPTTTQYLTVALTLAQILAANSVPIPLLAAQGAGTLIEVQSLTLDLIRGSAAFVGGGAMAAYLGTDSTGVLATATIAGTVFTTFAASQAIRVAGALAVAATSTILNKGLVFTNPTADFTVGTGGSGIVKLAYRVHAGLS